MSLQSTDLFVVQRGDSIYKVTADKVAANKKVTTVDVETVGIRPAEISNPFVEDPDPAEFPNQNTVNWYLYDRTLQTSNVLVGEDPPLNPLEGDMWWSTLEGNLFLWYDDGDSKQWVDASPAFVEIDYTKINEYIDQSISDSAVSQIIATGDITISPDDGKGVVTLGYDRSFLLEDQQRQDDRIAELESVVRDLADRLDQLQDEVAERQTIDGGYPNAEGVFDEDDTDGGSADPTSMTGTPISGGNAEGYD